MAKPVFTTSLLEQQKTVEKLVEESRTNAAGIAAAFSWVKQNMSATLPGIAVAVSLIPPLATIGIGLSFFSRDLITDSVTLFLLNTLGVVLSSIIVFSLFGYSKVQGIQDEKIKREARGGDPS